MYGKLLRVRKLHLLGSKGTKSTGTPRLGYENSFYNSFKMLRGAKSASQSFVGYETFRIKFAECKIQDAYNYVYIYYSIILINSNIKLLFLFSFLLLLIIVKNLIINYY